MYRRIDRFDLIITTAVVLLLAAIGIVVVRGDQIGIAVQQFAPVETASSRATIQVTFSEPVDPSAADSYFGLSPAVPGKFSAIGNSLIFLPAVALQPQQMYQVTIRAGLPAVTGRALKQAESWQFRVRPARVVYLSADGNLNAVDPAMPTTPQKLTDSAPGIGSYDIAPNGSGIIYAESPDQDGATSLYVVDLATNTTKLLYRCENALCANPSWRPDGGAVAFDEIVNGGVARVPRVWIFDLAANAATPLFKDNQIIANLPRWSPDGALIAATSDSEAGIIIHDFASGKDTTIPTHEGETATFSPDGKYLFFRKVVSPAAGASATHIILVDLSANPYTVRPLLPDSDLGNDAEAVWRADSKALLTTRRSAYAKDAKLGSQLTNIDVASGTATPIYTDAAHRHRALALSPTDDALLFQRTAVGNVGGAGLWLYGLLAGDLKLITETGTDPQWLP